MVSDPDPTVIDILYEAFNDDGLYLGVPRDGNCLRCIRMGGRMKDGVTTINPAPGNKAFCRECMDNDLDRAKAVRKIMFGVRRNSKG